MFKKNIVISSVLIALLLSACQQKPVATPEKMLADEVRSFFQEWANEGTSKVYFRTHSSFQKETDLRHLEFLYKAYKIKNLQEIDIQESSFKKNVGSVHLLLYDQQHIALPIKLHLGQEQEQWRIIAMDFDTKNYLLNSGMKPPDNDEMITIASHYLRLFQTAAKNFNINMFYKEISTLWQNNAKPDELLHYFQPLFENNKFKQQNLKEIETFVHPSSGLRDTGLLFMKGRFIANMPIDFEMEFFYEDFQWKAVSFGLSL